MERIIRFFIFVMLMEVATAVAITLADGSPFSSMSGWDGVLALVGMILVFGIIAGGLWALGKGTFDNEVLIGLVIVGTAGVAAIGFVGLKWLTGPMKDLADGGGIWWPIVVFIACVITWATKLGRR